ncbi:hypothetical protein ACFU8Q_30510 [Streptomyces sp. NPDC057543]|uniref:hypothetical protein n=1 Tax=Streptomyces sp. NPDC057543 TaxID=3346163 RepID=UPI0036B1A1FC
MTSEQDDQTYALLAQLAVEALNLASTSSTIAMPADGPAFALRFLPEFRDQLLRVEALATAVLRASGVPWDFLADSYGVTRQSLHRRLADEVRLWKDFSPQYVDLALTEAKKYAREVRKNGQSFETNLEGALAAAVPVWEKRREQGNWRPDL